MDNELKIWVNRRSLIYFKTKKTSTKEAFAEFQDICERIQVNIDNLRVSELELQDKDFNLIDRYFHD